MTKKKVRDSYDNKELRVKKVNEIVNPSEVKVELISSPLTKINTQQRHVAAKVRSSSGSTLTNRHHFDKLDLAISSNDKIDQTRSKDLPLQNQRNCLSPKDL